jgi:glycosyltransferase involved in cell wall biosynthesis
MRILFVTTRDHWPPTSGAKLRDYQLALALARRAEVTLISYAEQVQQPDTPGRAEAFRAFRKVRRIARPRTYTPSKLLRGLFSRDPITVINYMSAALGEAIESELHETPFDVVHFDSLQLEPYFGLCRGIRPAIPVVYDWHNIDSEVMRRFSKRNASSARRMYAAITVPRIAGLERRVLAGGSGHLVCSERERRVLIGVAARARIAVIENGVNLGAFPIPAPAASPRRDLVFVGSMDYFANIEAAVDFVGEVWPLLHARHPALRLRIVGSRPTAVVRALSALDGIEVTGTVPDVVPYYAGALASVVPLNTGGGTRLKILEAMAAGTPVISTPIGAEGLELEPGYHVLFAGTPREWVNQVTTLMDQPVVFERLVCAGRNLVAAIYDWEIIGDKLWRAYRDWFASGTFGDQ